MVRVVDCHAGVLGLNPGGPKDFPLGITSNIRVGRVTVNKIFILGSFFQNKPFQKKSKTI